MGEDFTNKSAVPVLFSAFKAAILFCFFRIISSLPRFFFMFFYRVVVYNNNNDNNNSRNHIKEKGFFKQSSALQICFVFFVLFLSSFTKFNAHNFMYSRVVVNRLSTAWPARWMLLASWCQLLRVQ